MDSPQGPGIVQSQGILSESVLVHLETGERLRVTLEEIMQIATARYGERGGGHTCNKCSDGGGGCGNCSCAANSMDH